MLQRIDLALQELITKAKASGQLTKAAPQKDATMKLDVQGDKLINRLVYRRIGDREMLVGSHSVKTAAGGGGG